MWRLYETQKKKSPLFKMHTGFSKLTSAMAWERHPTPHSFVWSLGGVFSPPLCSAKKQSGLEKKMPGMFVKLMSISRAGEKKAQRQWGVTLVRIMSLHVTQTGTRPSVNTFPFYALMWVQPFFFLLSLNWTFILLPHVCCVRGHAYFYSTTVSL